MAGTVLIVNPRSAGGRTSRRWPQLREIIHYAYGTFEVKFTRSPGDGTFLARKALEAGAELVVAMGGDGTINEVVNGFFDGERAIAPGAAFGVLPAGTGGDFVKSLGTPQDIAEAARQLKRAEPRPIDVGRLRFVGHGGRPAVRHFINIASFGISGLVDQYVNTSAKALGGTVSFLMATLKASLRYRNPPVRLELDGGKAREGKIYNVAVANGRYFGGGMKVAPGASLDDGLFDVITIGDMGMSDLLLHGMDIYTGRHLQSPKVSLQRARRVDAAPVEKDSVVLLDVDGEQPGRLPATFELITGALKVRASA
jgi:YegS/Rv2252/BmrU family lipid kinase